MEPNILLLTDSYKPTHWKQIPKGTSILRSYLESRGGKFDNTLFFGLQILIKKYLTGKVVTLNKINRAKLFWDAHLGPGHFNMDGWMHILDKHDGRLPVVIKAVPEGTSIPTGNVLLTIENTDPEVPWLTNYLETLILQIWYPITVGTLSREVKKVLAKYLVKTTTHTEEVVRAILNFMLHDFGFRGSSSVESAGIGAAAHIINFRGTDTVEGILLAQEYYNTLEMLAFSIPASEHSTITSWTEPFEVKAFENMLDQFPTGLVACVSDSYDIIRACRDHWGTTLRDKILNRDGRLVIRPDSGDPVQTLKMIFNILWEKFGGTINEKGFKVLDPHVRVIQGDGVNYESIIDILDMMVEEKFSVENIAFGMGGALLQKVDRDTQKFAIKCSSIVVNGEEVDVQKNPIEINEKGERVQSFKKSKSGQLKLVHTFDPYNNSDEYETVQHCKDFSNDFLVKVFEDGELLVDYNFQEVRDRAEVKIKLEEFV
jgi:nicotinamide phosphoribosyltransferase